MEKRRNLNQGKRRSGFTLVEILIVIAIIGILAAILFPVFRSARERGYQTSCASNLHQIGLAVQLYFQDEKRYPASLAVLLPNDSELEDTKSGGTTGCTGGVCPNTNGSGYLKTVAGLLCPDDDTDASRRSSYGDTSSDITSPYPDESGDPNYESRYTWNYFGYKDNGFAYKTSGEAAGGNASYLVNPSAAHGLNNPVKYSLSNRFATGDTIITHCIFHRVQTSDMSTPTETALPGALDIVLRLDGAAKTAEITSLSNGNKWQNQNKR